MFYTAISSTIKNQCTSLLASDGEGMKVLEAHGHEKLTVLNLLSDDELRGHQLETLQTI